MSPKRKPVHKNSLIKQEFDVDLTILGNRQLFLYEDVSQSSSKRIVKQLYALDTINKDPIVLFINSDGGSCSSGLAIINAMRTIVSPVVTIITGEASSIAGHISASGNKRMCYKDAVWYEHALETYFEGCSTKLNKHNDFIKRYKKVLNDNLRDYTKLTETDIKNIDSQGLYLFANEMKDKGIVDEIYNY